MTWIVYILRLRDDSLYTGITTDYDKRLRKHETGRGSKYVASRLPILEGCVVREFTGHKAKSEALRLEAKIKALPKVEKEHWIVRSR